MPLNTVLTVIVRYCGKVVVFIFLYFNIIIENDLELWARFDVSVRRIIHVSVDMHTSRGGKKKHQKAKTSRVLDFHKLSSNSEYTTWHLHVIGDSSNICIKTYVHGWWLHWKLEGTYFWWVIFIFSNWPVGNTMTRKCDWLFLF